MNISSLQSSMSRDQALRKLMPSGPRGLFRAWLNGKLLGLAAVYIPYRLYELTIEDRRLQSVRYYAIDAVAGTLDPYEFAAPPPDPMFVEVATRNCHPVRLDETQTREIALRRIRRSAFSSGLFHLSNPAFNATLLRPNFYIPYWMGFYGEQRNLKVIVLNALHQTYEGSKMRRLVETWLTAT